MKFSVLIANYNNGKYIRDAIKSVFNQSYQDWEIIIVDDGSTDKSIELLTDYEINPKVKIFSNGGNFGCGYTKRRCIEEASGEICGFLDPDDVLTPEAIEVMMGEHRRLPLIGLIHSTYYSCSEDLKPQSVSSTPKSISTKYIYQRGGSISHFASFKRGFYLQTVGLNPAFKKAVDQDLYLLLDEVSDFHFVNKPLYYYRIHSSGISTGSNELKAYLWYEVATQYSFGRRLKSAHLFGDEGQVFTYRTQYLRTCMRNNLRIGSVAKGLEKMWCLMRRDQLASIFNIAFVAIRCLFWRLRHQRVIDNFLTEALKKEV